MSANPPQVDLKQAVAIAVVQKRRHEATVRQCQERCEGLQREIELLKSAAASDAPRCSPLAVLCGAAPSHSAPQVADRMQSDLTNLVLWGRATHTVPPELQPFLGRVQRYLLLKEARQGGSDDITGGLLQRTPMRAVLEVMSDLLEASGGEAGSPAIQLSMSGATPQAIGIHLALAAACLAALCEQPNETLGDGDGECLQQFVSWLLGLASAVPSQADADAAETTIDAPDAAPLTIVTTGGAEAWLPAAGSSAVASEPGSIDTSVALHRIAQQLLYRLDSAPGTGLVLLSCSADVALGCLHALVASVTGEPQPQTSAAPPLELRQVAECGCSCEHQEAALLQAFSVLAALLHHCLRSLPAWTAAAAPGEHFMHSVAGAVWGGQEACQLIALTHPGVARKAQRATALLAGALQEISSSSELPRGPA